MTQRVLGPTGGRRRKRLALLLPFMAIAALILAIGASAGPVGHAAGFEGDDGNLAPGDVIQTGEVSPNFDWNSFAPVTYNIGTAPYRQATTTVSGWNFTGIEDADASTTDTAFAGGVKQDDNCAALTGQKAANKTDLRSAYFADARVDGDVYLALAWVRIEQNTTSPSSHVGFEFNQGETPCSATSSLVHRTAGDLLVVYDFGGGSADLPALTIRQWVTSGSCEVSSNSPPCWGPAANLTANGDAEGRVNTFGPVQDLVGPVSPRTLGTNEFGEAIINLSDAVETVGGDPCRAFGNAYAVSRSSGNSGTAQMKDLVGPANVDINLCGGIVIKKETTAPDTVTDFTFQQDIDDTGEFLLKDGESESFTDVPEGTYTVSEDDPSADNYALTDITCETDDGSTWELVDENDLLAGVEITLAASDTVTCTFTNTLQSQPTTTATQPSVIATLHDSATVSGANDATGDVTFKLWADDECTDLLHEEDGTLDGDGNASTTDGHEVTDEGTWYWTAHYEGDTLNDPSDSDCGDEIVTIDITPDPPSDD